MIHKQKKKLANTKVIVLLSCFFIKNVSAEDIVIHNETLDITAERIKSELSAQTPEIQTKLKTNEELFRKFVDAIHNEMLFEAEADKQDLKDDPIVADKIAISTRKVLIDELITRKKQSIKIPNMEPLALADYQAHPEQYKTEEQVHARHILVSFDEKTKAEKLKFMQGLKKRAAKGEDFAELAKQYSEDKGSSAKGGDLGVFSKGQMVKPFEDAAFALEKPKQLSDIFESKYGWHLIQLDEKIPTKVKPFAEVKAGMVANLEQDYMKNEMKSWRDAIIDPKKSTLNEPELDKLIQEIKKLP